MDTAARCDKDDFVAMEAGAGGGWKCGSWIFGVSTVRPYYGLEVKLSARAKLLTLGCFSLRDLTASHPL